MTTRNPDDHDPAGPSAMEPGPQPGTPGAESLLDAGSAGETAPGGVPEDLVAAARRGDARDGDPGDATGVGGEDDTLSPRDTGLPQGESAGRGESAGHRTGGATSTGR